MSDEYTRAIDCAHAFEYHLEMAEDALVEVQAAVPERRAWRWPLTKRRRDLASIRFDANGLAARIRALSHDETRP